MDIDLPAYENQTVVESYLIPGQPFFLLLTRSFSYFDPFPVETTQFLEDLLIEGAEVVISYGDKKVVLAEQLFINPFTGKLYNYVSPQLVPEDFTSEFQLEIRTKEGEIITSTTFIPKPIITDSLVVEKSDIDTLYRILAYWTDDPNEDNYFRRILNIGTTDSVYVDFTLDDRLLDSSKIVVGSGFDFIIGDTLINTIFHVTKDYYDFANSVFIAESSNGNPFSQPSTIRSNVKGANNPLGIFSGITLDQKTRVVSE
ncbi:MAG: DUF4249 domain-containing protein [Saprospiraceae bacterium]|nr:DUF4249 domain-containing protein [Saprospiraceae bacterium]